MSDSEITVKAVVAFARDLCRDAARRLSADPWAKPYAPSDATARKLSQQYGPERALHILALRSARCRAKEREDNDVAAKAAHRHEQRQRQAQRDVASRRSMFTPGQRIDDALAKLSVIPAPAAMKLAGEPVTDGGGSKDDANAVPRFPGDPAAKARRIADDAARAIERELDEARRRLLDFEREAA